MKTARTDQDSKATRLFQVLFGPGWKRVLRSPACFNVCPFRTRSAQDLEAMLIICNGNGLGRSPWAVIQRYFGMEIVRDRRVDPGGRGSRQVKEGRLQQAIPAGRDPGVGCRL